MLTTKHADVYVIILNNVIISCSCGFDGHVFVQLCVYVFVSVVFVDLCKAFNSNPRWDMNPVTDCANCLGHRIPGQLP